MAFSPIGNNNLYTIQSDTGKQAAKTRGKNELDMKDFMNLLVASMANQDMMNPVSDTEFIAQMAQFSSLQGINTLQEYTLSSYAVSYAGKYVVVAHQNEITGALEEVRGMVEKVSFYEGSPVVYVNGKRYALYEVMEVAPAPIEKPVVNEDTENGE